VAVRKRRRRTRSAHVHGARDRAPGWPSAPAGWHRPRRQLAVPIPVHVPQGPPRGARTVRRARPQAPDGGPGHAWQAAARRLGDAGRQESGLAWPHASRRLVYGLAPTLLRAGSALRTTYRSAGHASARPGPWSSRPVSAVTTYGF